MKVIPVGITGPPLVAKKLLKQPPTPYCQMRTILATFLLYVKLSWIDYKRKKCLTFIGILAIAICSTVVLIAQGLISKVPMVFYTTSATLYGDIDIQISKAQWGFLNGTLVRQLLSDVSPVPPALRTFTAAHVSPKIQNLSPKLLVNSQVTAATAVFLNIPVENEIGLNRKDSITRLGQDEVYISKSLAYMYGLQTGDSIYLRVQLWFANEINMQYKLLYPIESSLSPANSTIKNPYPIQVFRVRIYDNTDTRRFSSDLDLSYSVIFDSKSILGYMATNMTQYQPFRQFLSTQNVEDYADTIILQFKDRLDIYLSGDYNNILRAAVPLGSKAMDRLKAKNLVIYMPLVSSLSFTKFANAAISLTFNMILSGIILLSAYVINNIINMTISSKLYSVAIQRTVGLTRLQLLKQIVVYSLGFTIFGMVFSLPMIIWLVIYINSSVLPSMNAGFELKYEFNNVFFAVMMAVSIPLISALAPMISLMFKNIADSLDKERSKTAAMSVQLNNDKKAFPWTVFFLAIFSTLIGVVIYVFLPMSMASFNVSHFLSVFFLLLTCLLAGTLMIFQNFSYVVEYVIIHVIVPIERAYVKSLALMNLVSHRIRNRKTVFIYSCSLAFINFLFVTLIMQNETTINNVLKRNGSELMIKETENGKGIMARDYSKMIDNLGIGDLINSAKVSREISKMLPALRYDSMKITNKGGVVTIPRQRFFAIPPKLNEFSSDDFGDVTSPVDYPETSLTYSEYLHTRFAYGGAILSESIRKNFDLDCADPGDTFRLKFLKGEVQTNYQVSCAMAFDRFPGFIMSGRENILRTDTIFSMESYLSLFENYNNMFNRVLNYSSIYIKPKDSADNSLIVKTLDTYKGTYGYTFFYFPDYKKKFESTSNLMSMMFVALTLIVLVLSLFSLISTMSANIIEQVKELAVMRCIGIGRWSISRVFLYESITVILTGGMIGIATGTFVGWTLAAQNALFANVTLTLTFPWNILLAIVIFSLVASLLAAAIPTFIFLKQSIVGLLKIIS
jgi:ABC-type antimicrobial peptide transport system permease subunit